jgi:predicted nuclease of restriction endonuclease-like (RecB) superfamily
VHELSHMSGLGGLRRARQDLTAPRRDGFNGSRELIEMAQSYSELVTGLAQIHAAMERAAARSVDQLLAVRNWFIGAFIVEFEQSGEDRAAYGEQLLERLGEDLAARGCKGLSSRNLKNCRQVALAFPALDIRQTLSAVFPVEALPENRQTSAELVPMGFPALAERHAQTPGLPWRDGEWVRRLFASLSFSHLLELSRIEDPLARAFYEVECLKAGWSVRELKRQRDSLLFERSGLSRDKEAVLALAQSGAFRESPTTILRDPYVLEFLGLEQRAAYSESDLEQALIDHLQQFLLELGRDFCFMGRQYRITVGGRHHFIDLLFFHRRLRCLVAVDLKIGAFQHEDAGQMNFYLNYLREQVSYPDESPPVGIVLCAEKDAEVVHYATAGLDQMLLVSRYLVALPSEEQLKKWLHDEQELLARGGS